MDPIHQAAYDGNAAKVARLVQKDGQRLNAGTRGCFCLSGFKVTPLMYGACMGHDAVVERLLSLGADVDRRDRNGSSAAHWACSFQSPSTLALLLDAGASLNAWYGNGLRL